MSPFGRGRKRLGLGSGALLMLGIGTAALVGLPGMGPEAAPEGVIGGVVTDSSGDPVEGAPVALFDGHSNALLEITHSDREGRFGFQQDPGPHHLHAMAPLDSGLIGAWSQDRAAGQRQAQLTLPDAHVFKARVLDEAGQPITGAEVRVYARSKDDSGLGVLARGRTDADGQALLHAPAQAHVAAFSSDLRHRADWHFEQGFPTKDSTLSFTLHTAHPVRGTVVDEEGRPLRGILVNSWDNSEHDPQWNGYQLTGPEGTFLFFGAGEGTLLRATDRLQEHLPAERTVHGTGDVVLVLAAGERVPIRCRTAAGRSQTARIWSWSTSAQAWSWGTETNGAGRLEANLDPAGALVIEPLEASLTQAIQVFGQSLASDAIEVEFSASSAHTATEEKNSAP